MLYSQEQLADMGASNMDLAGRVAQASLEATERVAALQLKAAREALDQGAKNLASLLGAQDVQQLIAVQSAMMVPGWQNAATLAGEVSDTVARTQADITRLVEERAATVRGDMLQALETVTMRYPVGNEAAVAALKSVLAAAGSAYDSMTRAARQVVELAQAGSAPPAEQPAAPAVRRKAAA